MYAGTHAEERGGGGSHGLEYLSCAFGLAVLGSKIYTGSLDLA